jgi:cysteine desulfurase
MTKQPVYLDYAAATPVDDEVLAAMLPYYQQKFQNPSALYLSAKAVHSDIESARETVAQVLGARPNEIVFTAGGTEANNLAVSGIMRRFPEGNVITSAIEHDSVLRPAAQYQHRLSPVTPQGVVNVDELIKLIDDNTMLVSVMYANNELGTIQPITKIAQQLQSIREQRRAAGNPHPLYFHTDACQAANYLSLTKSRLRIDLMTLNGGKIYGPKQSGCLFVRAGVELTPQTLGGGQERNLRSGTENVAGIIGFAHALQATQQRRDDESIRLGKLQKQFIQQLRDRIPSVVVTCLPQDSPDTTETPPILPNFIHIRIPGADNERLVMELDEQGIQAAAGSACSASNDEPSHVLTALGLDEADAQSSIRFTMGRHTTEADIDRTVEALAAIDTVVYTDTR